MRSHCINVYWNRSWPTKGNDHIIELNNKEKKNDEIEFNFFISFFHYSILVVCQVHLSTYACVYLEVSPSDLLLFSSVMNLPWTRTRCPRTHCHTNTHTHAITELNRINNWVQFRLKLKGKFTGWVCSTDSHICVGRMAYRICAVILNNSHTHDYSNAQTRRSSSFTTTEKRLRTNSNKIHA